jgi:hypothetical protein
MDPPKIPKVTRRETEEEMVSQGSISIFPPIKIRTRESPYLRYENRSIMSFNEKKRDRSPIIAKALDV